MSARTILLTERPTSSQLKRVQADMTRSPEDGPDGEARRECFASMMAEISYIVVTLRRMGVQERDLEDCAQDVLIVAYRRLSDYDVRLKVQPWLAGIAYNTASDYRRLSRHRELLLSDAANENADSAPSAEDLAGQEQSRALVIQALGEIKLEQRIVLVMHDIEEHSMPEIAAALSIPLNTAYSRLRLAREKLKEAVCLRRRGER
ncbi:MAG: sigma-70 family RNA polymerase sigma factor [Byssovorax sp.]